MKNFEIVKDEFDQEIIWWQTVYSHEYENLVNSEELVALNPYYKGYADIIQMPNFIGTIYSLEKPVKKNTGDKFNDDLKYQLSLMNWYFIFEPTNFKKEFGFNPEFSNDFNVEKYRIDIVSEIVHANKAKK